jgi:hypothetical protein
MKSLLNSEPVDTQSTKRAIPLASELKANGVRINPCFIAEDGKLDFLPGANRVDELHNDPTFANEPLVLTNRNGASYMEFVNSTFFALWIWLYPDLQIPMGQEREKLRDHVHIAAQLKAAQLGLKLYLS